MHFDTELILATSIPFALILLYLSWKNPIYLLFSHVFSRVILDSLPQYTYSSVGSVSVMQVYTALCILIFAIYLFLKRRFNNTQYSILIYGLIFCSLVSTLVAPTPQAFFITGFKWIYLLLVCMLTVYTLEKNSESKFYAFIVISLAYALANQVYFGLTHPPKIGGGVVSYLGSYDHESNLAFILLGVIALGMAASVKASTFVKFIYLCLVFIAHIGIYFNNYRTAFVPVAVFWTYWLFLTLVNAGIAKKVIAFTLAIFASTSIAVYMGETLADRFSDIGILISNPDRYIDFSGNALPNKLLSGRIDIMNQSMSAYLDSGLVGKLIGMGPGTLESIVGVYAHNEYLSALVEMGLLGFLVTCIFILISSYKNHTISLKVKSSAMYISSMVIGFYVIALGTMPFRDTRSMMLLGIFFGIMEWHNRQARTRTHVKSH